MKSLRKLTVIVMAMLAMIIATGTAIAATDGSEQYAKTFDSDFTAKIEALGVKISDYTAKVFKKLGVNDAYAKYQWALDDANVDLVWDKYSEQLKNRPSKPTYFVVFDSMPYVKNRDFKIGSGTGTGFNLYGHAATADIRKSDADAGTGDIYGIANVTYYDNGGKDAYWYTGATADNMAMKVTADADVDINTYMETYHGGHIAGIAGALRNDYGIAGVAPNVIILPVNSRKNMDDTLFMEEYMKTLISQLDARHGKDNYNIIVNLSFAGVYAINSISRDISCYAQYKDAKNILFVNGAPNDNTNELEGIFKYSNDDDDLAIYPNTAALSMDNFIVVTNHTVGRELNANTAYSTSGSRAIVMLSAPGTDIISVAGRSRTSGAGTEEAWSTMTGTSMAVPMTGGVAALLWNLYPDATALQIKDLLAAGAKKSSGETINPHSVETATTIGGYVRWGFLDAAASVNSARDVLGGSCQNDTIAIPVKRIIVTASTSQIGNGVTAQLTASRILPYTANDKTIAWKTDNAELLTVTADGKVSLARTIAEGESQSANVWAAANDGNGTISNRILITASGSGSGSAVSIISDPDTASIESGASVRLSPSVSDPTAYQSMVWSVSGNEGNIVTTAYEGVDVTLTGVNPGTVTVTLTCTRKDGTTDTASRELTVTRTVSPTPDPTPDQGDSGGGGGCNAGAGVLALLPIAGMAVLRKKQQRQAQ